MVATWLAMSVCRDDVSIIEKNVVRRVENQLHGVGHKVFLR